MLHELHSAKIESTSLGLRLKDLIGQKIKMTTYYEFEEWQGAEEEQFNHF